MAITLNEVKVYLRIDSDAEDVLLERLMATAYAVVSGAVDNYALLIQVKPDCEKLGDMIQLALIADLYENRVLEGELPQSYSRIVETMLHQLQYDNDMTAEELQALIDARQMTGSEEETSDDNPSTDDGENVIDVSEEGET